MFRPSPFRTVLVALALASCGTRRGEIAIDTGESLLDAPESVTPPSGGEGLSVDPQTGAVEISVGFRETAPVDGEAKTVKPSPTMAPAGAFRWDDTLGKLDLSRKLNGGSVEVAADGPWTERRLSVGGSGFRGSGAGFGGLGVRGRAGGGGGAAYGAGGHAPTPRSAEPMMEMAVAEEAPALAADGMVGGMGGLIGAKGAVDRAYAKKGSGGPAKRAEAMDAGEGARHRPARVVPQTTPLRAGTTDDNDNLREFQDFVAAWSDGGVLGHSIDALDVSDAKTLIVRDPRGRPIPGARVSVTDLASDRLVWTGVTYGDGSAPWYPRLRSGLVGDKAASGRDGFVVQAYANGVLASQQIDADAASVDITLDDVAEGPTQLDVVFLIDTTGSMGDEIDRIKKTLLSVTSKVRGLSQEVDLRYGAVLYRDIGDEYVTRAHPLTGDIAGFDKALQQIRAAGGGDGPESLNQGLAVAVDDMDWREQSAKLVFLVADAPPHMDYQQDVSYGRSALAALHRGIRIHTVAASGLDDHGSVVFRQTAQLAQGKFIFIEYGSTAAAAADHGVRGQVQSNNLDDILYRQIEAEVTGWGASGLAASGAR